MKLQPRPSVSSVQNWLLVEVCRLRVRCGGEPASEEKVNEPDGSRLGGKRGLVLGYLLGHLL